MSAPRRLHALVVDDERLARQKLRRFLASEPDVASVEECASGQEAVQAIRRRRPDLLFLDIEMPGLDGFAVLERLHAGEVGHVVFVTAHDRYAVRAFEVEALDYLLKPFDGERFRAVLARARRRRASDLPERLGGVLEELDRHQGRLRRFLVRSRGRLTPLPVELVEWIESADNYARLHTAREEHLVRETLAALEQRLDPARFARAHRRAIVNLDAVAEVRALFRGGYELRLRGGATVPVGRAHRERLLQLLAG